MAGAALAFAQWGKLAFFSTLLLHYATWLEQKQLVLKLLRLL